MMANKMVISFKRWKGCLLGFCALYTSLLQAGVVIDQSSTLVRLQDPFEGVETTDNYDGTVFPSTRTLSVNVGESSISADMSINEDGFYLNNVLFQSAGNPAGSDTSFSASLYIRFHVTTPTRYEVSGEIYNISPHQDENTTLVLNGQFDPDQSDTYLGFQSYQYFEFEPDGENPPGPEFKHLELDGGPGGVWWGDILGLDDSSGLLYPDTEYIARVSLYPILSHTLSDGFLSGGSAAFKLKPGVSQGGNDFDADGDDDLLLQNDTTHKWHLLNLQDNAVASATGFNLFSSADWVHQANMDVDGDGDSDVLLRNTSTGDWKIFTTQNGAVIGSNALNGLFLSSNYTFQAVIDVDGDGDDDILLRNNIDGKWRLFTIQNGLVTGNSSFYLWSNLDYVFAEAGDFDGDRDDDVLLRGIDGKYRLFTVASSNVVGFDGLDQIYKSSDYTPQVASDFDGDGDDDLIIRSTSSGKWRLYEFQNNTVISSSVIYPYQLTSYEFQAAGDFDADGDTDLLLRSGVSWAVCSFENGVVVNCTGVNAYGNPDWQIKQ